MDTKRLLVVAQRIEKLEKRISNLKNEARGIVAGVAVTAVPKRKMSAAAKKKISEAMKRNWAARRKR
jgi:hypothetical protein